MLVSYASLWELSIKVAKGKLLLPGKSIALFLAKLEDAGFTFLQIEPAHILRTETLPHIHKDPFDRMIVAQAIEENLTILSIDTKIPLYQVNVIWS
jgi:PIN domain nuclease of toxin-antitoxin system